MQHRQVISVSPTTIKAIREDNTNKYELLGAELKSHVNGISSLLTSYHWDERGIVNGVTIDEGSISIDQSGKGNFKVNYGTNIHYGCSDKDIELEHNMRINISIDLNTGEAIFTGEYIPEREPDSF